jgi:hypothetical protein
MRDVRHSTSDNAIEMAEEWVVDIQNQPPQHELD